MAKISVLVYECPNMAAAGSVYVFSSKELDALSSHGAGNLEVVRRIIFIQSHHAQGCTICFTGSLDTNSSYKRLGNNIRAYPYEDNEGIIMQACIVGIVATGCRSALLICCPYPRLLLTGLKAPCISKYRLHS